MEIQVAKEVKDWEIANADLTRETQILRDEKEDLQSQVAELDIKVSALVTECNQLRFELGQAENPIDPSPHYLARKDPESGIQQGAEAEAHVIPEQGLSAVRRWWQAGKCVVVEGEWRKQKRGGGGIEVLRIWG